MKLTIGIILSILIATWGAFTYLDRFATCEEVRKVEEGVKKVDQKADKTLEIMEYKFRAIQLETIENRIGRIKDSSGDMPKDPKERERLRELEQDRKRIERELRIAEEKTLSK